MKIFGIDDFQSSSLLNCFISHKYKISEYILIRKLDGSDKCLCLQVKNLEDILFSHIITSTWVLHILKIKNNTPVSVVFISPLILSPKSIQNVELCYIGHFNFHHWDEAPNNFIKPNILIKSWPNGIKKNALILLLPHLLNAKLLFFQSIIAVKALDTLIVLKVMNNPSHAVNSITIHKSSCVEFSIVFEDSSPGVASVTNCEIIPLKFEDQQQPEFFKKVFKSLSAVLRGSDLLGADLPSPSPAAYLGPRSFLLSSPQGGGKSHLLQLLRSFFISSGGNVLSLSGSGSGGSLMKTTEGTEFSITNTNDAWPLLSHLKILLGDCSGNVSSELLSRKGLLVLLDDVDELLEAAEAGADSNSVVAPVSGKAEAAAVLRSLLYQLSSAPPAAAASMVVVAASRRSANRLKGHHDGCPEFESVLSLPPPSLMDRCQLLRPTIQRWAVVYGLQEVEHCCDSASAEAAASVTEQWISRLAGLLGGHLPADIFSVLQRAEHSHLLAAAADFRWSNALAAVAACPPLQIRSLVASAPERLAWEDFGGYSSVVDKLRRLLRSLSAGRRAARGALLHGPSGCGKSFLARVIACEAKMNFVSVRSIDLLSKYFGETEEKIRDLFRRARLAAPCVLFFDDFDAIACKRMEDGDGSNLNGRILSTFLNELDGVQGDGRDGLLVLAACADMNVLDAALLRPGRLQLHVNLTRPTAEDLLDILRCKLRRLPCAEELIEEGCLARLAASLGGERAACCDVDAAVRTAVRAAVAAGDTQLTLRHFLRTADSANPPPPGVESMQAALISLTA